MDSIPSEQCCNCANGSYGVKHTSECYEKQIERLRQRIRDMERDHREDMRSAVAEERRSIETGEPYGTY